MTDREEYLAHVESTRTMARDMEQTLNAMAGNIPPHYGAVASLILASDNEEAKGYLGDGVNLARQVVTGVFEGLRGKAAISVGFFAAFPYMAQAATETVDVGNSILESALDGNDGSAEELDAAILREARVYDMLSELDFGDD